MAFAHTKTTYVRPLCESNGGRNVCRQMTAPMQHYTVSDSVTLHGMNKKNPVDNFKHLEEIKTKELDKLNSVHSKLFAEVEEIQKWKTAVEMESRQEKKKVEELQQTIESQRKVLLDLQLQNENLSYRLSEEIQQRSFAIEKLHSTKELFSALKKHFNILQGRFDYSDKIKEMMLKSDSNRMQEIEALKTKYEKICMEHSERVGCLNSALAAETNKALTFKEELDHQLSIFENEKESLYSMFNNSQNELQKLLTEIEDEKKKSRHLLQEKREMESTIMQLENSNEGYLLKIEEKEENLKVLQKEKQESETKFVAEHQKLVEVQKTYDECLQTASCNRLELEENISNLKQAIENLDCDANDLKKRIEEEKIINEKLDILLQDAEKKKCILETRISDYHIKLENFEVVKNDFKELEERYSQLLTEKMNTNITLEKANSELLELKSENENSKRLYEEKQKEYMKSIEEHINNLTVKEQALANLKEKFHKLVEKIISLEEELEIKSKLIEDKDKNILNFKTIVDQNKELLKSLRSEIAILKDNLEKEKIPKECIKCPSLQEKINEMEVSLSKANEELSVQTFLAKDTTRMLNEIEVNYTSSCLLKEKEILDGKKEIRRLQDEIILNYIKKEVYEEFKSENTKLKEEYEAFKLEANAANKKQFSDNKEEKTKKKVAKIKNGDKNVKSSFQRSEEIQAPIKSRQDVPETTKKMNEIRQKRKSHCENSTHLKSKTLKKTMIDSTDSENTSPPEKIPASIYSFKNQYEIDSSGSSEYFEMSYFNEQKNKPWISACSSITTEKVNSKASWDQKKYQSPLIENIATKRKYSLPFKKPESGNSIWTQQSKLSNTQDVPLPQKSAPIMASQRRFFKKPLAARDNKSKTKTVLSPWF